MTSLTIVPKFSPLSLPKGLDGPMPTLKWNEQGQPYLVDKRGRLASERAALRYAYAYCGGLGMPGKMPGYGYGLSPTLCKRGSMLRKKKGSVCEHCYGMRGRYQCGEPKKCAANRYAALVSNGQWAFDMAAVINTIRMANPVKGKHFRWHDSGDLQGKQHLADIAHVARLTPDVQHWLPTKEAGIVKAYVTAERGNLPANLTIRVSADMINQQVSLDSALVSAGVAACTVHRTTKTNPGVLDGYHCPASFQGGKCVDCRACWDKSVKSVSYKYH